MSKAVSFRPYTPLDKEACLAIFDANCPRFFAPAERADYLRFLDLDQDGYEICSQAGMIVGAFGLIRDGSTRLDLRWILLHPKAQGSGIGKAIMSRIAELAKDKGAARIRIAASHLSAPFFGKFGAVILAETENGWGAGYHRIDMELNLA